MDPLQLEATGKTPFVRLDPFTGELVIRGLSISENADRFYQVLFDHIETYSANPTGTTRVEIQLAYFNSSSAKYLLDILKLLDELHATGRSKVSVTWLHAPDDLDLKEAGEDLRGLLDMPFKVTAR